MFKTVINGGGGAQEAQEAQGAPSAGGPDYTILEADDSSTLSTRVNALIRIGWEPVGGVSVSHYRDAPEEADQELWAQALINRPAGAGR
jgi:hypothetical protein